MKIDYESWYDTDFWEGRKRYRTHDGRVENYHGPALEWLGFDLVADALAPALPGKTLLDVACGGGDLASKFLAKGYDAYGVDISQHAIDNCVAPMRGRIAKADVTDCPEKLHAWHAHKFIHRTCSPEYHTFPDQFDVVISTDFPEHVYAEDWPKTFDWLLGKTKKWLFLLIATTPGEEFVHTKGEEIPLKWETTAVSGHINVKNPETWGKMFENDARVKVDYRRMFWFQVQRDRVDAWKNTGGWQIANTWFLRRV